MVRYFATSCLYFLPPSLNMAVKLSLQKMLCTQQPLSSTLPLPLPPNTLLHITPHYTIYNISFSLTVEERNQTFNLTVRRSLGMFGDVYCFYFLNQLTASTNDFYVQGVMNGGPSKLLFKDGENDALLIFVYQLFCNFLVESAIPVLSVDLKPQSIIYSLHSLFENGSNRMK